MGGHPTSWLWRYVAERYGGPPTVGGKLKTARGSPRRPGLAYHSFRATRWRARRFFLSGSHTLDASTRIYTVRSHTVHESAKSKDANARRHHRCKIERFRRGRGRGSCARHICGWRDYSRITHTRRPGGGRAVRGLDMLGTYIHTHTTRDYVCCVWIPAYARPASDERSRRAVCIELRRKRAPRPEGRARLARRGRS